MLRVAMVGTGGMARTYRECYAKLPDVEWSLAIDVNDTELENCIKLGAKRTSKNFSDALGPGIDVVDISTPNHLHEEQAISALNAGKHVLLQKPMSNTLSGADNIMKAARASKGNLGMYMSSYTQPLMWEIKQLIDSGALGKIQSIRARDAHRGGLAAKKEAWRGSLEKTGGGSFIQLSIHSINMVQWWLGAKITEVSAFSANQYCPNIGGDDVTTAIAKFENGIFGVFDSGYASVGGSKEIFGSRGTLRLFAEGELELTLDQPWEGKLIKYTTPEKLMKFERESVALNDTSNPYNQHRMFLEAIAAGKTPHMTGEHGWQDLAVVMAVYDSAKSGLVAKVR
ncbi:MAG TPA: Gfo/Idh/MocA family oxidoreductase [Planctomycetota bacterium]|nr:Gfo/Idh/MocA family oxidoreductase [Planctomycetota bacterium]